MDLLLVRDGMFALEVKVEAFASKDLSGRKSYTKGRVFKLDVEYGSLTLDLLLKHLATELNLCNNQTPTVWFFDKRLNEDARLVDEIQMVDLFEMHKEEMTCQVVVGVFDSSICVEHEFDPLLGRAAGRPKVQRQRGCLEKNPDKKKVRCSRCRGFGHLAKTCKLEMVGEDGETATTKKRLALP